MRWDFRLYPVGKKLPISSDKKKKKRLISLNTAEYPHPLTNVLYGITIKNRFIGFCVTEALKWENSVVFLPISVRS